MAELVEAEVAFGDAKITIRGPQEFVKSEVTRLAGLARGGQTTASTSATKSAGVDLDGMAGAQNEREFVTLKSPKGHSETATVLGFWLMAQGASEFSEDDIRRAYVRAGVRPPKVVSQALRDAKR